MKAKINPDTQDLFALFPLSGFLSKFETVSAEAVPPPYHDLLVHPHHMTVTVEAHHHDTVDVKVLEQIAGVNTYARKIVLVARKTARVVQFGLVRIHLQHCSPAVREEIVGGQKPLGRILIEHNVLRRIEPILFLRVMPGPALTEWFGLKAQRLTYGRQALIHCDGEPAIELLEIVAPE